MNRAIDGPVHHEVRGLHLTVDARIGGHHQRRRLIGDRADVAAHHAVHSQPATEDDIALDASRRADEAIDPVLWLARLVVEHALSPYSVAVIVARGWFEPVSKTRT